MDGQTIENNKITHKRADRPFYYMLYYVDILFTISKAK